jgi:DNA-binding FadR family transcriptional regulator
VPWQAGSVNRDGVRRPAVVRPVPADRASEIAEEIRDQILSGKLKPGDAMPTAAALTATYGVAPPTMRAALRLLEAEGLLRVHRGARGGPRIEALDVSALARQANLHLKLAGADLADLLEALTLIQPGAVELAAERRTDEQLGALWAIVDRVDRCETTSEFSDAAADFLLLLLEASNNHSLKLFVLVIGDLVRAELHRELFDREIGDPKWFHDRFAEVVQMIELRQGEAAAALWRAHLVVTHPAVVASAEGRIPFQKRR